MYRVGADLRQLAALRVQHFVTAYVLHLHSSKRLFYCTIKSFIRIIYVNVYLQKLFCTVRAASALQHTCKRTAAQHTQCSTRSSKRSSKRSMYRVACSA